MRGGEPSAVKMSSPISLAGLNESTTHRAAAGLSIVVPVFNEAENLSVLHFQIVEVAKRLRHTRQLTAEVIYVDDGSKDATLSVAHRFPADEIDVQIVSLSRNFG